ncbi:MAG: hypothetical protein A2666_03120 [Parcubacteria group bacterium RIFCSPHIGHO2_01_FULL_47_10b]|nr:MAG: hypothetical protein A2666_03120 [Parcubacteria group bacterium RIFCSPHIGHO2_01_FULL_47_10b]
MGVSFYAQKIEQWYERHERHIGSATVVVGFFVDMIMFQRIDRLFDAVALLFYLVLAAIGITIVNLYEGQVLRGRILDRLGHWLPLIIQYSFGGLFSAFVVYFIKNASFSASWPFLLLLAVIVVGNEFFRKRYAILAFHIAIYFLAIFSFFIFALPILLKAIDAWVFILAGVLSLLLIGVFLALLNVAVPARIHKARLPLIAGIGVVYVGLHILYFTNIIPPIPLALTESGVFHTITRVSGNYQVTYEPQSWFQRARRVYEPIHIRPGEAVYIFSAVFAPTQLRTPIQHHWYFYDEVQEKWISKAIFEYPIVGGREGGYRGYSLKRTLAPGKWRIDVETKRGQVIGRVRAKIEYVGGLVPVETKML